MRTLLIILLSISFSSFSKAGFQTDYPEIKETILTLGLELNDFSTLWPRQCRPQPSNKITKQSYNEHKFLKDTIDQGFFSSEIIGDFILIKVGLKCKALNDYYFNNKYSKLIDEFIKKDKLIINKYGFSSIDLFKYPYNFEGHLKAYNKIPGYKEMILKQIKRFKDKNVFNVKEIIIDTIYKRVGEKLIEVKVAPYSEFIVTPTESFNSAHKILREKNNGTP